MIAGSLASHAQVISNFDSLGGVNYGGVWVPNVTFNAGIASVGSPSLADGNFEFADISAGVISINTGLVLNYTARVDANNLSNSFLVRFADSEGNYSVEAIILTNSWTVGQFVTGTAALVSAGPGNLSDTAFFTITGDGASTAFRMSFDSLSISAVPEPSTYAAIAGVAALGFCAVRRRRKA